MGSLLDTVLARQETKSAPAQAATKALAWARVSTTMQEERGLSIPEQLRQIREYADREGIEIVGEYHEADSAFQARAKRTEFHRMLQRAKDDSEVGVVLVHDFSRFSRDSLDGRVLKRELKKVGVEVLSVTDPVIDSETGSGAFLEALTFAKNEAYSRDLAMHTKKGCTANVQARDPDSGWCYKNGGQPLWGYKAHRIEQPGRHGRATVKCIWVPDDTVVAGKPVQAWTREVLGMAGQGATIDELRDFLNHHRLPAPRSPHWGQSTLYAMLQPHILLKYAGHEVYNVHRKNGRRRPPSEWITVERAHEALIPEALALRIIERRKEAGRKSFATRDRTLSSPYLLSGGLFVCGRCGGNMVGIKTGPKRAYYVCASAPYRKGVGCGKGVYVPKAGVEQEVLEGVRKLLEEGLDPERLARQVNEEVARNTDQRPAKALQREIETVQAKIGNVLQAVEDGISEAAWANQRLGELRADLKRLEASRPREIPRLKAEDVSRYLRNLAEVLEHASTRERKDLLRLVVERITLAPEDLRVEITYRAPGPNVMNDLVAGVGFEPTTFGL